MSKDLSHSFDVAIAVALGSADKAIILKELKGWCAINLDKKNNLIKGRAYTYITAKDLHEKFPYMGSESTIARWLLEMEKNEWISSGVFNKIGIDRTKWYSVNTNKYKKALEAFKHHHLSKREIAISQNEKCISQNERPIPTPSKDIILTNNISGILESHEEVGPTKKEKKRAQVDAILSFTEFWDRYKYKSGSKSKAEARYYSLPLKAIEAIKATLDFYVACTVADRKHQIPGSKFWRKDRKLPTSYLNAKEWEAMLDDLSAWEQKAKWFRDEEERIKNAPQEDGGFSYKKKITRRTRGGQGKKSGSIGEIINRI